MDWYIKFNSGTKLAFGSEDEWTREIEEIAESTPYDLDVDYYTHSAYVDDGDFDEFEWDNDWRDENGDF